MYCIYAFLPSSTIKSNREEFVGPLLFPRRRHNPPSRAFVQPLLRCPSPIETTSVIIQEVSPTPCCHIKHYSFKCVLSSSLHCLLLVTSPPPPPPLLPDSLDSSDAFNSSSCVCAGALSVDFGWPARETPLLSGGDGSRSCSSSPPSP